MQTCQLDEDGSMEPRFASAERPLGPCYQKTILARRDFDSGGSGSAEKPEVTAAGHAKAPIFVLPPKIAEPKQNRMETPIARLKQRHANARKERRERSPHEGPARCGFQSIIRAEMGG